jgi:hypothetical protein
MSRPDPADLSDILDRCLARMQDGADLDAVLSEHPDLADDLRPILEAVLAVWANRGSDTVPVAAMNRSRAKLLSVTRQLNSAARAAPWWKRPLFRLQRSLVPLAAALLIFLVLFTGLASAQSLPGQPLYSIKRAAEQISLAMPGSPSTRLAREESYDLRRKEEVEALLTQNREEEVYFTGFLTYDTGNDIWKIDDIHLQVPDSMLPRLRQLENHYVSIHADILANSSSVVIEDISQRVYTLTGNITQIQAGRIRVDDVWVMLTETTQINFQPVLGKSVRVSVTRMIGNDLVAVLIESEGSPMVNNPTMTSQAPDLATETFSPEDQDSTQGKHPSQTPEIVHPNDNPQSTQPSEDTNPTKTGESDSEKDSNTNKKEATRTPTPTSRSGGGEKENTRQPDRTPSHDDDHEDQRTPQP